ncbi:hypothetical protein MRB53_000829 [Persea americana]|uniref:Uncharacterized protein n=1 Tax=Persea americana TaxID=3435 RepID=A0ACC2MQ51_PERAE|nr:hypothetical protein MRB53_000829 [Persea americana]
MVLHSARFDGGDVIDKVDRTYIRTTCDHVVKPKQQDEMIKRWPPREIFTLESHCPFFSNPEQLVELLIKASASTCPNQ